MHQDHLTTSISATVLGVIGVGRRKGRKERIPGRAVAPVRENCLVSHLSRRRTVGGEGGREERKNSLSKRLPQKQTSSHKSKQGRNEGGKIAAILKKREDTDAKREDGGQGCCPEVLI